ncbi:aspartyl-phosphate phosphatase Spo0E family protein [Desulforamulus ruminis]|uniref:aspartyl-phosphate phosphatase Spo0E family protein n=1 Tax=Desulforamulus ruminis TaxID=1564 RepID=UPI003B0023F0
MYRIKIRNRKTHRKQNYLDILIRLGRTRLRNLEAKMGRTHPRVIGCSQWLDRPILEAQKIKWFKNNKVA